MQYPVVRRDESVVEELFGRKIADPYRWLENPDAPETVEFVKSQNEVFFSYLKQSQLRDKFHARLTNLFNYEKYGCPFKKGNYFFYFYNPGLEAQSSLFKQTSLEAKPELLLDPKTFSDDGTSSLNTYSFTESGETLAYAISQSGSDWTTVYVRRVSDLHDFTDKLEWVKFSGLSWTHDEKGFFYSRYPKPEAVGADKAGTETNTNLHQKVYYHLLGNDQAEDVKVFETPENPTWMSGAFLSDDGDYVLISISESTDPVNKLYIAKRTEDWREKGLNFIKVVDNFDASYDYITNDGDIFYFKTNLNAPKYKIVTLDFSKADDPAHKFEFKDLIPEKEDPLEFVVCVNQNKLITVYLHDVKHEMSVNELQSGKFISKFDLPIGSITGITGRKEDSVMFYKLSTFLDPGAICSYDFSEAQPSPKIFRATKIADLDPSVFKVDQVFYPSKDGTKVPMFIISGKETKLDGTNPTFLYGYGGFSISLTPSFSASRLIFVQNMGGIVAVPNLRGGGEYGEEWHKAGNLKNKQNVFDDFQAAADYLIEHKYTSASKICINGGSNGGLLVGACLNQRPDLFGCAISDVGVLDMLRFHKFTIGHAWKADYGDPDAKDDFEVLFKYSPLHNIRSDVPYPAVLITTGDHDDRVVPLHSLKMIASLQHELGKKEFQKNPLVVRVETKAGHGAGKPTKMMIDEMADKMAFLGLVLGIEWKN